MITTTTDNLEGFKIVKYLGVVIGYGDDPDDALEDLIEVAKEIGANAVLLIVSTLKEDVGEFLDYAKDNDLECLVEVHNEDEVEIALDAGAKIVGINNRDLKTLKIDLSTTERLAPLIPKSKLKVGESGIYTKEQLNYILKFTDAALIGSSIMESKNIKEKVMELAMK